jgi:hypothetical protein
VGAALTAAARAASAAAGDKAGSRNYITNGGAEEAGAGGLPAGWEKAFIPSPTLRMTREARDARAGLACLYVENRTPYPQPTCDNWLQNLTRADAAALAGKRVQLSAWVRTQDVPDGQDGGVNVCVQCWDTETLTPASKMVGFASTEVVHGTTEWTRLQSEPMVVPTATKLICVRASLLQTGRAAFDDIELREIPPDRNPSTRIGSGRSDASAAPASRGSLDPELLGQVTGEVVDVLPVDRDQMVLAYLPDWAHGRVDNIAVANNDGGVRTLLAWPPVEAKDRKCLLALYARESTSKGDAGPIGAYAVLADWDEQTSWTNQPKVSNQPAAELPFKDQKGWRVFDVTKLANAAPPSHGVMLRFESEDKTADTWSGYAFVSREGEGEWATKRPVLLVVK